MLGQSASNWLHVESDKQTLDESVKALTQQADDLDGLLRSVQQSVSGAVPLPTFYPTLNVEESNFAKTPPQG